MPKIELHKVKRKRANGTVYAVWMMRWWGTDGKRYGETLKHADGATTMSKRDALSLLREAQGRMDHGEAPIDKPHAMTLEAFKVYHAEIARGELSAGSMMVSGYAFDWAIKVLGGKMKLTAINAVHVARIRNALADAGSAPGTIQQKLTYLRSAFNRAIAHKLLTKGCNPFAGIKAVEGAARAKEAVIRSRDEIRLLKAGAPDAWWRSAIGLWFAGLRQEEALAMKWDAVDFNRGEVTIRKSAAGTFKVGEDVFPLLEWRAKTANSYRAVPVPPDTMTALRSLHDESDGSPYVFLTLERLRGIQAAQNAGTWRTDSALVNNVLRDWQNLQRRVLGENAKIATVHDCRKTFCTHAADLIPIQTLAKIVGDTPNVLMRYYTRPKDEHADKLRAAFDDAPALKLVG